MRPGVQDSGVIDHADALFTVNSVGVDGFSGTQLLAGGIVAEVQEGLSVGADDVVLGQGGVAVGIHAGHEELVVLSSHDTHVTSAVDVGESAFAVNILSVSAVQQNSGDQRSGGVVVQSDSHVAGHTAQRVAGDTDAGGVNVGQAVQNLHGLVQAHQNGTQVVNVLRVAVSGHILSQDHEASAGQLDEVEVLHFAVVVHTVADHDGGGGILSADAVGNEQQTTLLITHGVFPTQILNGNGTEVGLDQGSADHADQHQDQCDA